MVDILRLKINWTGFPGGPGYTNLHFRNTTPGTISQAVVDSAITATDIWLEAWKATFPSGTSVLIDPTADVLDETNGDLKAFMSGTPTASRTGSTAATYSAPTGACVNWYTNAIRNGRRIRGRTFMIPLGGGAWDTAGSLENSKLTAWRTATGIFVNAGTDSDFGVWSRPSGPDANDGVFAPATSYTIQDRAAILTSRRD